MDGNQTLPGNHGSRGLACGRYLAALAVCLLVLGTVLDLRSEAPFAYRGDTMFYHLITKSVIDGGWFQDVPLLGAPGTLNMRDVPTSDNSLHVVMLWVLSVMTSDYPTVLNVFFLLTFPLTFLSALVVLRHFGVTWWTSVCASVLYAFIPLHVARGAHHLFLSAYWQVPLAVLVALWVSGAGSPDRPGPWHVRGRRLWLSLAICAVLATTGFYYAFFACFFLFVASVVAGVRHRRWRAMLPGLGLMACIGSGVSISLLPSVLHMQAEGTVPVVQRLAGDADTYGLRVAQLLLPVRGHRLESFREMRARYTRRPLINENDDVSLGVVGALGFVGLLWWFFFCKPAAQGLGERGHAGLLHHLSIFNVAGVLYGTIGGFGSLVAFFGLTQVRALNRISVFLCFFAFFGLALWLDGIVRRFATTRPRTIVVSLAFAGVTVLALLDQISPSALPDYRTIKAQFASDATFVRELERNVPHGAQIFQLPLAVFPESPPVAAMPDYDLLRGYLHSDHLRWSYGTIRGREGHAWLRRAAALPSEQFIEELIWAGFNGIVIHRSGFSDRGARIEDDLRAALRPAPLESPDGELVFYSLQDHREHVKRRTPRHEWESKREAALHPVLAVWREGFSDEFEERGSWQWGASRARMTLVNRAAHPQDIRLEMAVFPNPGGSVTIHSDLFDTPLRVPRHRPRVERTLRVPPGQHDIRFSSDAPAAYPPDDFRDLVFAVQQFKLNPVGAPLTESTLLTRAPSH